MRRIITAGLAVIWTVIIFSFSIQSGEESGSLSFGITDFIHQYITLFYSNLSVETLHIIIRKSAHVIEYAILGYLYADVWNQYKIPYWLFPIAGLIISLLDEAIQLYSPNRGASLIDAILFDFSGYLISGIILLIVNKNKTNNLTSL